MLRGLEVERYAETYREEVQLEICIRRDRLACLDLILNLLYAIDTDAEDTDRELYGGVVRYEGDDTGLYGQRGTKVLGVGTAIVLHTVDNAILGYRLRPDQIQSAEPS